MTAEPSLTLGVTLAHGQVAEIHVTGRDDGLARRLFRGRSVAETLSLMPRVFALCGVAQGAAAAAACGVEAGDGRAVAEEALAEQATTMLRDWPNLIDESPDLAAIKAIRREAGEVRRRSIDAALFGDTAAAFLATDPADWIAAARTLPARVLAGAIRQGAAPLSPTIDACETGPWTRRADVAALRRFGDVYGAGVGYRLYARLVDAACLSAADAPAFPPVRIAPGAASVDTARGRLRHRVQLDEQGRIADYAIQAPTDDHFRADGPLAQGLVGLPATDSAVVLRAARFLVAALDPCIPCAVVINSDNG